MNVRFVVRGSLLALIVVLVALAVVFPFTERGRQLLPAFVPEVPAAPVITAPRGPLPNSPGGLIEWTQYAAERIMRSVTVLCYGCPTGKWSASPRRTVCRLVCSRH